MTNIELETFNAVKSACRSYSNKTNGIDWEQRRYELVRDMLCAFIPVAESISYDDIDLIMDKADHIIEKLKK